LTTALTNNRIAENTSTTSRIKVADLVIADDALGTNAVTLSGADATAFEVEAGVLYLKAGTSLNFESKSSYAVTVNVADSGVAGSTPATANYALTVTDVNEAPTALSLTTALTNNRIAENASTTSRIKVADLVIADDALGTNAVTLSGADATAFEVEAGVLYLKAGTVLDFETKTSFSVTVHVADSGLAGSAPATANYMLAVTDMNENPTGISLSTSSIASNAAAGAAVGTFGATDPDVGSSFTYSLVAGSGGNDADNALFGISGDQLILAAGAVLSPSTNPLIEINVKVTDGGGLSYTKAFVLNVTAAAITTAVTASQTYIATPSVRDIFEINADSFLSPTIRGFEAGDTLKILNLSELTGIQVQNDPGNPPPLLTIGNASVGLETSEFFFNEETFKQVFGSDAVIYA
jgi:hypothetical protein